jgi:hypothetical protein
LRRVRSEYLAWSPSVNVVLVTDSPLSDYLRCNEDTVTIVDVTDKSNPEQLSRTSYAGVKYTHQGWLTEDHNTFLFGDELDEKRESITTTTFVLNVSDLKNPRLVGSHLSEKRAIDHNQYILGNNVFQANYKAGLQVLEIGDVTNSVNLIEIAWFDVYPESDAAEFNGAWSNYPYFASGNVIVSSIDQGLFVLKVDTDGPRPPTKAPTVPPEPTNEPTKAPTTVPIEPTNEPTKAPTVFIEPTSEPTKAPTVPPESTNEPTMAPTEPEETCGLFSIICK